MVGAQYILAVKSRVSGKRLIQLLERFTYFFVVLIVQIFPLLG